MARIQGTVPDPSDTMRRLHDPLIEVSKDGLSYHLTIEGMGRGTVTMGSGNAGSGRLRLVNDEVVDIAATRLRHGLRYRIHRGPDILGEGLILDLPP